MTSPAMGATPTFPRFIDTLSQRQTPALLWYSVPGERIELSGRVLNNWVAKTANLLVDECDLEANQLVTLPKRLHWRSLILALAALRVGAEITFDGERSAQVFATFEPAECAAADAEHTLVLASEPLAPRFNGKLPAEALDYAAEVRSHPDVYMGFSEPDPQEKAWEGTSYRELMLALKEQAQNLNSQLGQEVAALCLQSRDLAADSLAQALVALSAGYAVLILDPHIEWDQERVSRVWGDERAQLYPAQQQAGNRS